MSHVLGGGNGFVHGPDTCSAVSTLCICGLGRMVVVPVPVPTSSAFCTQELAHGLVRPCGVAGDLDLIPLERGQVELAINGKRQSMVTT